MSDEEPDLQWTDHTRERFRVAASALLEAVRTHSQTLLAMTGRQADLPTLFAADADLAVLVSAYADAQFDFTGTFPPLGLAEDDEEQGGAEYTDDEDEEEPVERVSILHRADYRITDSAAIMQAGKRAYRNSWPDDTDDDAAADVSNVGRALYQLQHARGFGFLADTPGLEAAGAVTWIVEAIEVLDGRQGRDWPDNPFSLGGSDLQERLLHSSEEFTG